MLTGGMRRTCSFVVHDWFEQFIILLSLQYFLTFFMFTQLRDHRNTVLSPRGGGLRRAGCRGRRSHVGPGHGGRLRAIKHMLYYEYDDILYYKRLYYNIT